jgi:hypothetical protein
MTWAELTDRVVLQFGTNPHNKAMARKFLEEAESDMAFFTKCLVRDRSIVINNIEKFTALPSDFIELKSSVTYDDRSLESYRHQEPRMKRAGVERTGSPRFYSITNDQIILVPHPTSDSVLNFQYIAKPQPTQKGVSYRRVGYKDLSNGFFKAGTKVQNAEGTTATIVRDANDIKRGELLLKDYSTSANVITNKSSIGISQINGVTAIILLSVQYFDITGTVTFTDSADATQTLTYTGKSIGSSSLTGVSGWTGAGHLSSGTIVSQTSAFPHEFDVGESLYTVDDEYDLQIASSQTLSELSITWDSLGLGARATLTTPVITPTDGDLLEPQIGDAYHLYLCDYAKGCLAEEEGDFELSDRFMNRYYANREAVRSQISGKGTGSGTMVVSDLTYNVL